MWRFKYFLHYQIRVHQLFSLKFSLMFLVFSQIPAVRINHLLLKLKELLNALIPSLKDSLLLEDSLQSLQKFPEASFNLQSQLLQINLKTLRQLFQ